MLEWYDFSDALSTLFLSKNAFRIASFQELKGARIGIHLNGLLSYLLSCPNHMSFLQNLTELIQKLAQFGITIGLVEPGITTFDKQRLISVFNKSKRTREKIHFFFMLYRFLYGSDFSKLKEIMTSLKNKMVGKTNEYTREFFYLVYSDKINKAIEGANVPFVRAPQSVECQLNHMLQSKMIDWALCSPILLIISAHDEFIHFIDTPGSSFKIFDIKLLAESFKCTVSRLRIVLFGSMLKFFFDAQIKSKSKADIVAHIEADNVDSQITSMAEEQCTILAFQIQFLLKNTREEEVTGAFIEKLSELYGFDTDQMIAIANLFFNSPVVTSSMKVVHPVKTNLPVNKRLLIDEKYDFLTRLLYKRWIKNDALELFNKCSGNKCVIVYPRNNFSEFIYAYKTYFKGKLAMFLSKVSPLLKCQDTPFKFQFFKEPEESIELDFSKVLTTIPAFNLPSRITFFDVIFEFYRTLKADPTKAVPITSHNFKSIIYANFLHDLGYIDIVQKSIMVSGAAFFELKKNDFQEEIMIAFEMIRNNLLSNEFFYGLPIPLSDYNALFLNNIFDYFLISSMDLTSTLRNMGIDPQQISNYISVVKQTTSQYSSEMDMNSSDFSLMQDKKPFDLKSAIQRTLSIFYVVIKSFKLEYKQFIEERNLIDRSDRILAFAFKNSALSKIQLIARLSIFIKTNANVENFYAYDLINFQHLVNIIQRGLNIQFTANAIAFILKTGQSHNYDVIRQCFKELPFVYSYSHDMCIIVKTIMCSAILYTALKRFEDPFASQMAKSLTNEHISKVFNVKIDICQFLEKGLAFIESVFNMVINANKYAKTQQLVEYEKTFREIIEMLKSILKTLRAHNPEVYP